MSARTLGLWLWLLIGGLAAAAIVWQLRYPPRPLTDAVALHPPELPTVTPPPLFQLPSSEQSGDLVARPLFIAARRPEPPSPDEPTLPEKPPAGPEQTFMLMGVLMDAENRVALLRPDGPNAKVARIKAGEMLGEWRLDAIFPHRIVLRKGDAIQEVTLTRPKKTAGPRAKRADAKPSPNAEPAAQTLMAAPPSSAPPIPPPPQ